MRDGRTVRRGSQGAAVLRILKVGDYPSVSVDLRNRSIGTSRIKTCEPDVPVPVHLSIVLGLSSSRSHSGTQGPIAAIIRDVSPAVIQRDVIHVCHWESGIARRS